MKLPFMTWKLVLPVVFGIGVVVGLITPQLSLPRQDGANRQTGINTAMEVEDKRGDVCIANDKPVAGVDTAVAAITNSAEAIGLRPAATAQNRGIGAANAVGDEKARQEDTPRPLEKAARLVDAYLLHADGVAESLNVAEQLAPLIGRDPTLLDYLLERDWPTREHLKALLSSISVLADEAVQTEIRDLALDLSYSTERADRAEGLYLLSSLHSAGDPEVRQRLLDIGWTDDTSAALVPITAALIPTFVSPAEREEIVALLSDLAQSHVDAEVRASGIHRLSEWEGDGESLNSVIEQALNDRDPIVRTAGIHALASGGSLAPEQRNQLLELTLNPEEDPSVRLAAAQALSVLQLSEKEYQAVASVLTGQELETQ